MESDRPTVGRYGPGAEPGTVLGPDHAGRMLVVLEDGHALGLATVAEIDAAAARAPGSVSEHQVLVGRRPGAPRA